MGPLAAILLARTRHKNSGLTPDSTRPKNLEKEREREREMDIGFGFWIQILMRKVGI